MSNDISNAFQESLKNFNSNKQQSSGTGGLGGLFGGSSSGGGASGGAGTGGGALDSLMGGVRSATQNISSSLGMSNREPAEPEFCGLTSWQRFVGFAATFAMAAFCFMVSLFSLPLMIISPSKFVTPFTFGSLLAICSFALIKGPRAYIKEAFSKERLSWTVCYFGSLILTLYFSLFLKSYLLTIVAVVIQIFTLGKFFGSYAPSMSNLSMMSMFGGGGGGVSLPV
ncbi:Got1/Sft2-like family-domain-containing protein [Obelidium mucronatum]|nr:Got1/Sft2-like family-domain-containing protein [Obelidium mucronatum]